MLVAGLCSACLGRMRRAPPSYNPPGPHEPTSPPPFEPSLVLAVLRDPSGVTQYIQATSLVLQPPGTCVQPSRFDADDSVEKAFTHAHMLLLASWVEYQALVKHLHISATHPIAEVALIQEWGARRQDALVKKLEESRGNPTTCPDDM